MARKTVKFEYFPYAFPRADGTIICSVTVHLSDAHDNSLDHCFGVRGEYCSLRGPRDNARTVWVFEHAQNTIDAAFDRKRMLEALGYKVVGFDIGEAELCAMIESCIAARELRVEGEL